MAAGPREVEQQVNGVLASQAVAALAVQARLAGGARVACSRARGVYVLLAQCVWVGTVLRMTMGVARGTCCLALLLARCYDMWLCQGRSSAAADSVTSCTSRPSPAGHSHRPVSWLQLPVLLQLLGQALLPRGGGRQGTASCLCQHRHQLPLVPLRHMHSFL